MIVSTREAVSKVMSEFHREGVIEVRNRTISVTPQLLNTRLRESSANLGAAA